MPIVNQKIRIITAVLVISFLLPKISDAQRWKRQRYDFGIGLGTGQVFGDIGGTADKSNMFGLKDIKFDETRLSANAHMRFKYTPLLTSKLSFFYGMGAATDANSRNDRGRAFSVQLYELNTTVEYYILAEDKKFRSAAIYNRRGMVNNYSTVAAYLFAGLGATYSISSHADAVVESYDSYRSGGNISPVIPFGAGAKYIIDERSFINAEFGYRFGLSDYIEGYKQTQASKLPDVYYFFSFSYCYRLKTTRRNLPAFIDNKFRRYGF